MPKRALIISGGGSRGAYAVGAIDHMVNTLGLRFDLIAGTSTGALIAPLVVTGEIDRLIDLYTSVDTDDILTKRGLGAALFRSTSLFRVDPLADLIQETITPSRTQTILSSARHIFITTVSLQTGQTVYFHTGPEAAHGTDAAVVPIASRAMLMRAILASACQPVFMPPIDIEVGPPPAQQFVDGGVREVAPLRIAIENGATELYVILLAPAQPGVNGRMNGLFEILAETFGLFGREILLNDVRRAEVYSETVQYLDALRRRVQERFDLNDDEVRDVFDVPGVANPFEQKVPVTIHVIQPQRREDVPLSALEFDREEMRRMLARGRERAAAVLEDLPPRPA